MAKTSKDEEHLDREGIVANIEEGSFLNDRRRRKCKMKLNLFYGAHGDGSTICIDSSGVGFPLSKIAEFTSSASRNASARPCVGVKLRTQVSGYFQSAAVNLAAARNSNLLDAAA
jgi:hypothetical protein